MRRQWNSPRFVDDEGTARTLELATALAQMADPDFLEKVIHLKSMLDSIGGQVYIAAYRDKFDGQGNKLEDHKQPGDYATIGYLFHYDHIAKITRAPVEPDAKLSEPRQLELVEDNFDAESSVEDEDSAA